jgi:hypothetical protein
VIILSSEVGERAGFAVPAVESRRVRIHNVSREIDTIAFYEIDDLDALVAREVA